jgi:hypothetical protein
MEQRLASFGQRVSLAFASMIGLIFGSMIVIPVGYVILALVFGIAFSGVGSSKPIMPAGQSIVVMQILVGGFAGFATAVFIGTSIGMVLWARRWERISGDVSAASVAFAMVLALYAAVTIVVAAPHSWGLTAGPQLLVAVIAWLGALAGTIPRRPAGRVSAYTFACVAMIGGASMAPAIVWGLMRPPTHAERAARRARPPKESWAVRTKQAAPAIVAVAHDGTLYYDDVTGRLHALRATGRDAWVYDAKNANVRFGSGAIGRDGTVYTAAGALLVAFDQTGYKKWDYDPGPVTHLEVLALAADDTIYLGVKGSTIADESLRAITSDGGEKWRVAETALSASIGEDGMVYVVGPLTVSAYTPDGSPQWRLRANTYARPAIGADGTLYAAGNELTAIGRDGVKRWTANVSTSNSRASAQTPVVDSKGTIYVANANLYAVGADGTVKWEWQTETYLHHPPVLASDGTIVVADANGRLFGLTPDGARLWVYERPLGDYFGPPPVGYLTMTEGAVIYITHLRDVVAIPLTGAKMMQSPWPQARHDPQQTAQAGR